MSTAPPGGGRGRWTRRDVPTRRRCRWRDGLSGCARDWRDGLSGRARDWRDRLSGRARDWRDRLSGCSFNRRDGVSRCARNPSGCGRCDRLSRRSRNPGGCGGRGRRAACCGRRSEARSRGALRDGRRGAGGALRSTRCGGRRLSTELIEAHHANGDVLELLCHRLGHLRQQGRLLGLHWCGLGMH